MDEIYFNAHLTQSIFFKPEQLYDKNRKILKNLEHIEKGNIYFIAERGKIRVDPKKIKLSSKGRLRIDFRLCDGEVIRETIDAAPLFIDLGEMFKKIYIDTGTLQKHMRSVEDIDDYKRLLAEPGELPIIGLSLIPEKQTKKNVALRLYTPDGQANDAIIPIHSIISAYGIVARDYPRIAYIGKSSSLVDRIYKHEKIQQALAELDDDSDIYLYAFQFDSDKIIKKNLPDGSMHLERNHTSDVSAEDAISLVEMSLINYFKPTLNIDYVDAEIPSNEIFKRALRKNYTHLVVEAIHDAGSFWKFGTEHMSASTSHTIKYNV
jgi:hypothetical protein